MATSFYSLIGVMFQFKTLRATDPGFDVHTRSVSIGWKARNPVIKRVLTPEVIASSSINERLALFYECCEEIAKAKRPVKEALQIFNGYSAYRAIVGEYALNFPYLVRYMMKEQYAVKEKMQVFMFQWERFTRGRDFFLLGKFDLRKAIEDEAITNLSRESADSRIQLPIPQLASSGFYKPILPSQIIKRAFPEVDTRVFLPRHLHGTFYSLRGTTHVSIGDLVLRSNKELCVIRITEILDYIRRYSSWWQNPQNRERIDELPQWMALVTGNKEPWYGEKEVEKVRKLYIPANELNLESITPAQLAARARKIEKQYEAINKLKRRKQQAQDVARTKMQKRLALWRKAALREIGISDGKFLVPEGVGEMEHLGASGKAYILRPIGSEEELDNTAEALNNCAAGAHYKGACTIGWGVMVQTIEKESREIVYLGYMTRDSNSDRTIIAELLTSNMMCWSTEKMSKILQDNNRKGFIKSALNSISNVSKAEWNNCYCQIQGQRGSGVPTDIRVAYDEYRRTYFKS